MDRRKWWMRIGTAVALSSALAGCGHGSSDAASSLPPMDGQYRSPIGTGMEFRSDGTFGNQDGRGRFKVDGSDVVLTASSGLSLSGKRTGPNEFVLAMEGKPDVHFIRVGAPPSGSANKPSSAAYEQIPRVDFDRAVPLTRYAELSPDGSAEGLAFLYAALREPPLTDDEKLSLLSTAGAKEPDAFKRRDLAQTVLPAINQKLVELATQRYYRITVSAVSSPGSAWSWNGPVVLLGTYDMARNGFPSSCIASGAVLPVVHLDDARTYLSLHFNEEERPSQTCFLPVPDEVVARALETARVKPQGIWASRLTVYFYAVRTNGKAVAAVLTHATLTFETRSDDGSALESQVEVSLPQSPSTP